MSLRRQPSRTTPLGCCPRLRRLRPEILYRIYKQTAMSANEQLKRGTLASGAASRQRDDEGASAASHRRRRGCSRETQLGERQGNATGYITIATNATDDDAYPQRGLGDEGSEGTGCRPRDSWGNPHRDPDAVQGPREGPGQRRVAFDEVIGRRRKIGLMLLTE